MSQLKDYLFYRDDWATIYCGDCLTIMPLMEPESVDLVLTDPPYNFEACGGGFYGVKWHGLTSEPREYLNKLKDLSCIEFNPSNILSILTFDTAYFFCNKTLISKYLIHAEQKAFLYDVLVMFKTNPIPAKNNHFLHDLEYIILMRKPGSYFFCDDYKLMSKVFITSVGDGKTHPAEKPVKLCEKLITVSCSIDGTVLDPFLGSGTTCVAAKNLNRKSIGIEINPKYCEIAVKRLRQEVFDFRK